MPDNPEKLTCLLCVICDDVYRDEESKKIILAGLFSDLLSTSFPSSPRPVCVFVQLANAKGKYTLSVAVEHAETGVDILRMEGPYVSSDPLGICDILIRIPSFVLPAQGKYWLKVESDGEILSQRPMHASLVTLERSDAHESE